MSHNYDVERIRADFPILKRDIRGKKLVYLDSGASSLKPKQVADRLSHYYQQETANVHRGAHFLAEQGTLHYEGARSTVQKFLNARDPREIVFTRGTTESINLVAAAWGVANLTSGDEIILSELEHHSNIVPWQQIAEKTGAVIKVIPISDQGEMLFEQYLQMLSSRTKIVSISWCSNVLGTITPIKKYIDAAHASGAKVMIDAAQAVSAFAIDVTDLGCDFLAFSGHKLFGPYGIGVLYARAELLEAMPPYQSGGSMIGEVTWAKTTWAALPHKFEAGTPNISGAIGLATAIDYVQAIGMNNIAEHEHELLQAATSKLKSVSGLRIVGEAKDKIAVLSFTLEGAHPSDIGAILDHQGIAIRAGHHCCQPLMRRLGIPATARATFSIYNTQAEIDLLCEGLNKAKEFF
jgi:cysteine desulfurase/selenocysteine lyase